MIIVSIIFKVILLSSTVFRVKFLNKNNNKDIYSIVGPNNFINIK